MIIMQYDVDYRLSGTGRRRTRSGTRDCARSCCSNSVRVVLMDDDDGDDNDNDDDVLTEDVARIFCGKCTV